MDKPIVTFDLETTGVNTSESQIVQYAFYKITIDYEVIELYDLVKPGIPIEKGASEVTGITNEMVAECKPFKYHIPAILEFIEGCIFAGYNIRKFDIPLLVNELKRNGIKYADQYYKYPMMDAMVLYSKFRERTLSAAYQDLTGKQMSEDAHNAMVDVKATWEVLMKLAQRYADIDGDGSIDRMVSESTPQDMLDFAGKLKEVDGKIIYTFGKHMNKGVLDTLDTRSYARWMLKSDFPNDTKEILKELLNKKK